MDVKKRAEIITDWINNYCDSASYKPKALIVGISGGIDSSEESEIGIIAAEKSLEVAKECNAIIFVVDGRTGLNAADELLADSLRRLNKRIVIAINKSEGLDQDFVIAEFSTLQIFLGRYSETQGNSVVFFIGNTQNLYIYKT